MKRFASIVFVLLAAAAVANAAPSKNVLDYTPIACAKAGEMPVLQLNAHQEGELRAFFRKVNTTDWCSVEGDNLGPLSKVLLPKFENGDEIEYFIVLLDGKRVIAKSPQIYRISVSDQCESPWARHVIMLSMDCSLEGMGSVPSSLNITLTTQQVASPSSPN